MEKIDFTLLSLNEISFLVRLMNEPEQMGFSESQSDGRIAAILSQKGLIQPFGKANNKIRWQVVKDKIEAGDKELLNRMNGTYDRADLYRE